MIQHESWAEMQGKIIDLETNVHKDFEQINALASTQALKNLNKEAQESRGNMQQLLSLAEEQLRAIKKHWDISSKQLQVQQEMAMKMFSQDEEKCHQLFRLTKDNKDETYEWYKNRVEDRVEGTCQWFLNHVNFQEWLRQDSGLLLVSADPGCGKSVLAKFLINCKLPRSATICYFFKDQDQNTIKQALCALLHQLFSHKPSLIRHAMPEYSKNGPSLANITTLLWDILEKAGTDVETGPVIFVLDALDECTESDFRDLISKLKRQFQKPKTQLGKAKFLLTSRPYGSIVFEFQKLVDAFPYIRIPGEDESETISQEVNCVITHQVNQPAKEKQLATEIKDHLQQKLLKIPHRTYLWVYLVFDYLRSQDFKKTKNGIESPITTLPESVNQAYNRILSKSKNDHIVRKALSIVLAANRPLTLAEMNIALNIDASSKSMEDLDLEIEEDFKGTLRSWCGLFISIYHGKVYFLHQTAREFLLESLSSVNIPKYLYWHRSISMQEAHSVLAESCIVYLDFLNSKDVGFSDQREMTYLYIYSYIFLDYSATNWAAHFREARIGSDKSIVRSVLRVCDPYSKIRLLWFKIYWENIVDNTFPNGLTTMMIASYFGHEVVVQLLLAKDGIDINAKDTRYHQTPLSWAARRGHEAVVQLLLAKDSIDVNAKDRSGRTPLSWAAGSGHEAVVQLLLAKNSIDFNANDSSGRAPLSWAVENGHEAVILLLLAKYSIDVNPKNSNDQTPLSWAVENGHEDVVQLLLAKDSIDVNPKNSNDQTPLSWAAKNGHEVVVQMLLAKDTVDVNTENSTSRTPLSWAAGNGHNAVVQQLLAIDGVDVNAKDSRYSQTPLLYAARNRHEAVARAAAIGEGWR